MSAHKGLSKEQATQISLEPALSSLGDQPFPPLSLPSFWVAAGLVLSSQNALRKSLGLSKHVSTQAGVNRAFTLDGQKNANPGPGKCPHPMGNTEGTSFCQKYQKVYDPIALTLPSSPMGSLGRFLHTSPLLWMAVGLGGTQSGRRACLPGWASSSLWRAILLIPSP